MKKFAVILIATLSLSACHYGKKEAGVSLERNTEYKNNPVNPDQGPEINPDYVKGNGTVAPAADTAHTDDTTAQAPAAH